MRKHFFLIDDDEDELLIFSAALNNINIPTKCTYAHSVEHALEMLKFLEADFIFIDVNIPGQNGFKCLQHIKQNQRLSNTVLVMYSNSIDEKLIKLASEQGAHACFKKTSSIDELTKSLELLLLKTMGSYTVSSEIKVN